MYTLLHYKIMDEDHKWIDSLEVNGDTINLASNSDSLLTHGINTGNILPQVSKVNIEKIDNKIKVPINLSNGTIYDLVLDVSKDENVQYFDMFIKKNNMHLIRRICCKTPTLTYDSIWAEDAFLIQATKQGFYVINFFQGSNTAYMYFMLDNDYSKCYKAEFSYDGNPLNFMCEFKKFTGPDDKELVKYCNVMGIPAADKYRFIKGKDSVLSEFPVPFYIDKNELILCPELDCKEVVNGFLAHNSTKKPIIVEYHYSITKEELWIAK